MFRKNEFNWLVLILCSIVTISAALSDETGHEGTVRPSVGAPLTLNSKIILERAGTGEDAEHYPAVKDPVGGGKFRLYPARGASSALGATLKKPDLTQVYQLKGHVKDGIFYITQLSNGASEAQVASEPSDDEDNPVTATGLIHEDTLIRLEGNFFVVYECTQSTPTTNQTDLTKCMKLYRVPKSAVFPGLIKDVEGVLSSLKLIKPDKALSGAKAQEEKLGKDLKQVEGEILLKVEEQQQALGKLVLLENELKRLRKVYEKAKDDDDLRETVSLKERAITEGKTRLTALEVGIKTLRDSQTSLASQGVESHQEVERLEKELAGYHQKVNQKIDTLFNRGIQMHLSSPKQYEEFLSSLKRSGKARVDAIQAALEKNRKAKDELLSLDLWFQFIAIQPGEFRMGSPPEERGRGIESDEETIHRARIEKPYQLGRFEVTQGQWKKIMGNLPAPLIQRGFVDDQKPVVGFSQEELQTFLNRMNARGWGKFRLPTNAEWEFAARGANRDGVDMTHPYFWGADESLMGVYAHANAEPSKEKGKDFEPKKVAQHQPSPAGLYDIIGNVAEYVQDSSDAPFYMRGGSGIRTDDLGQAKYRSAFRKVADASLFTNMRTGIRLVREVDLAPVETNDGE